MIVQPVQLVGGDDGGLARRQAFRDVKNRMSGAAFRNRKMECGDCVEAKVRNVRTFRTWDGLRSHLITFHGIDHRIVPE